MEKIFEKVGNSLRHLEILNKLFLNKTNFIDLNDWQLYNENYNKLSKAFSNTNFYAQLYGEKGRQMILADLYEYIFLGRGYYSVFKNKDTIKEFIKMILYFVNLLMSYECMTIDNKIRKKFLEELGKEIPEIKEEELYNKLFNFEGKVGLTQKESDADKKLNQYFDKILPKTAGGLWHELLVYIFLLRHDLGYIVPLLLTQRFLSGSGSIVPPDFLIITKDKDIYGIEVGKKKEVQSGSFSLTTNIPTATIDTINSRCSDRCPICKRWILFCPRVINDFSNLDKNIGKKAEIKCLDGKCPFLSEEDIAKGKCPYTKYSRNATQTINHKFTDGLHYHYRCILNYLKKEESEKLIKAKDFTALKTHYPYYAGLEMLFKK